MINLGTLKEIADLRSIWPHEALNFTPWVAENVELLADADVVIWVVKHAREEHKAAVEWLNNHTDDKIGFFLCEIKLFQIGDSDMLHHLQ